jgi:5'-nucleotidase
MMDRPLRILVTNDDGIESPGLWTVANTLAQLGEVTVAAPREQASGTGRSLPISSDGRIEKRQVSFWGQAFEGYAVGGTPAQVVLHAISEIMPAKPDLVVSGINYGENVGNSIAVSGTVGAAMEAASWGIQSIAASLQLPDHIDYTSYSDEVDFSVAAYFVKYFAEIILKNKMPQDVDALKIDVPRDATPESPWRVTKVAPVRCYGFEVERKGALHEPAEIIGFLNPIRQDMVAADTDFHAVKFGQSVSVTPLSLDMTSRIGLNDLQEWFTK